MQDFNNLTGVIYIYSDGSQYECRDVQNYKANIENSSAHYTMHKGKFKPVKWEKITPDEPITN